jgi:hypothetical protein
MALGFALLLIGIVLLVLGLVFWPTLAMFSSDRAERTAQLAAAIGGGFLAFIGLILMLTSLR